MFPIAMLCISLLDLDQEKTVEGWKKVAIKHLSIVLTSDTLPPELKIRTKTIIVGDHTVITAIEKITCMDAVDIRSLWSNKESMEYNYMDFILRSRCTCREGRNPTSEQLEQVHKSLYIVNFILRKPGVWPGASRGDIVSSIGSLNAAVAFDSSAATAMAIDGKFYYFLLTCVHIAAVY